MSLLDEIKKQPGHVRETMFWFSVVITVSLVGMVWFRSFEEDLFVLMNPEPEKQEQFYANRSQRTPVIYANVTKAIGGLRATMFDALGFFGDYGAKEIEVEEEYQGEVHKLPLSGER